MSTDLRSAFDELAREATPAGDPERALRVARRRTLTRAVAMIPLTAVVVLAALSLYAGAVGSRPVQPASGPGSLPDQIFPTGEHLASLQRAPIGRVSLVYSGALVGGVTSWVAVGADSDQYRVVTPFVYSTGVPALDTGTAIDVSPDGGVVAVGGAGPTSDDFGVDLVDASSGTVRRIPLPEEGRGGAVEALSWSPDGARIVARATVIDGNDPDGSSGHSWYFTVDVATGDVTRLPEAAVLAGAPAGWTSDGRLVVVAGPGTGAAASRVVVSAVDDRGVDRLGAIRGVPPGFGRASLSPDGERLAGLVDPTPSSSGDGSVWDLEVYALRTGNLLLRKNLSSFAEDESYVVGWRDPVTPVLSAVRLNDGPLGELVAVPSHGGGSEVLVTAAEPGYYLTSRVAMDVLAGGEIRRAEPPEPPRWFDPGTYGPWLWDRRGWILLIGLSAILVVAVVRSRRRGRGPTSL